MNFCPSVQLEIDEKWFSYFKLLQEAGLPIKSCEIIMDKTVAGPARNRWDKNKAEK